MANQVKAWDAKLQDLNGDEPHGSQPPTKKANRVKARDAKLQGLNGDEPHGSQSPKWQTR